MYMFGIIFVHLLGGDGSLSYKELYFHLFNAITDALRALELHDSLRAFQILRDAQIWGEEKYLQGSDLDPADCQL